MNLTKTLFFDSPKVLSAVDKATRQVLSKFGAFVRRSAKSSIRKRKRISSPGQPPSSHSGFLKKFIWFGYEPGSKSVVIGPAALNANGGKQPGAKLIEQLKQGIQIKHAEMDRFGDLKKSVSKLRVIPLLLAGAIVLSLSGCGAPMGRDISSGSAGGNAIKLADSNNNVVIITDGQLQPAEIIDSASKLAQPKLPVPDEPVKPQNHEKNDSDVFD